MFAIVEVRDSRTGYLVSVRDDPVALPDGQSFWDVAIAVRCHLEIQVDILARESCSEFSLMEMSHGKSL